MRHKIGLTSSQDKISHIIDIIKWFVEIVIIHLDFDTSFE